MDYSQYPHLEFRRKVLKLVGAEISIKTPEETEVGFIKMAAFKFKEDIRLYTDSSKSQEVFRIKARSIIDFGATYDVFDPSDQIICSLQRKGLRSTFVRDTWNILDATGTKIGFIQETSGILALIRRWLSMISDLFELVFAFVIETYTINQTINGTPTETGTVLRRKNPVVVKMALDQTEAMGDSRINIAATAMLAIMDANKNS
jgi:hypothetical protein